MAAFIGVSGGVLSCGAILGIPGSVDVVDDAASPAPVSLLNGVGPYCLGYGFGCAVVEGTQIVCWGRDIACLSDAAADASGTPAPALLTPTVLPLPVDSSTVTALTCGTDHACGLLPGTTGTGLFCWGQNREGQVTGTPDEVCHGATAINVAEGALHAGYHLVQAVSAGDRITCALAASDNQSPQVQCWGAQLADGQAPYVLVPPPVNADGGVPTMLAVGGQHACAYVVDGGAGSGVYCWGRNSSDQLGPVLPEGGLPGDPLSFHEVGPVASLTASVNLSCYEVEAGAPIMCTGTPVGLGCGSSPVWVPIPANPPLRPELPGAGLSENCFLEYADAAALDIRCLGDNSSCQLGYTDDAGVCTAFVTENGGNVPPFPAGVTPLDVQPNGTYACITGDAGYGLVPDYQSTCTDAGTGSRQCTDAEPADRAQFPWASGFVCARGRGADGTIGLYCWGSNAEGELGRGEASAPSPYPAPVIAPR